jgi:phage terminase Nu1 subunit (DNA packaging protein)
LEGDTLKQVLCSADDLAGVLDISAAQIFNLARAGVAVKVARGKYDLVASMKNYFDVRLDEQIGNPESLIEARVRLTRAQAGKAELELAELHGRLLPFDIALEYWGKIFHAIQSRMLALPQQVAFDLGLDREAIIKIDDHVRDILDDAGHAPFPPELNARLNKYKKQADK